MSEYIRNQILGIADNFKALASMAGDIEQVARICTDTLKAGNKIMFCGNGGSAADSQHLAAELVGRYKLNRPAMNALALTVDTSILTAVGNDYGYETVFSRQLEEWAVPEICWWGFPRAATAGTSFWRWSWRAGWASGRWP